MALHRPLADEQSLGDRLGAHPARRQPGHLPLPAGERGWAERGRRGPAATAAQPPQGLDRPVPAPGGAALGEDHGRPVQLGDRSGAPGGGQRPAEDVVRTAQVRTPSGLGQQAYGLTGLGHRDVRPAALEGRPGRGGRGQTPVRREPRGAGHVLELPGG